MTTKKKATSKKKIVLEEHGVSDAIKSICSDVLKYAEPPRDLSIAEFAKEYVVISADSAEPGKYRIERTPYIKGIFEAILDPETEEILMVTCAQVAKTMTLMITSAYFLSEAGNSILFVFPSLAMAQSFSKEKFAPFLANIEPLQKLLNEKRGDGQREASDTVEAKFLANDSWIVFAGASAQNVNTLSSRSVRYIICDEISRINDSALEGSILKALRKRASSFFDRKLIFSSTPVEEGSCKATAMLNEKETKIMIFKIICPECGKYINLDCDQVMWKKENPLETCFYQCQLCKKDIKLDQRKNKLLNTGKWFPKDKYHAKKPNWRKAFTANYLMSPWVTIKEGVREFLAAVEGGEEMMRVWVNTYKGEAFQASQSTVESGYLYHQRVNYPKNIDIPKDVCILTAGVDTGKDGFHVEIVGWTSNQTSYSITYKHIYGDPHKWETYYKLNEFLKKDYKHELGFLMKVSATGIDTGGHHTSQVYDYVHRFGRQYNIHAFKGREGTDRVLVSSPSRIRIAPGKSIQLRICAVDIAKSMVYSSLSIPHESPGCAYFPKNELYDAKFFKELTCERVQTKIVKGRSVERWVKPSHIRCEPLDCRVYNTCVLDLISPDWEGRQKQLDDRESAIEASGQVVFDWDKTEEQVKEELENNKKAAKTRKRRVIRSRYTNDYTIY